jgi:hypothetical protein
MAATKFVTPTAFSVTQVTKNVVALKLRPRFSSPLSLETWPPPRFSWSAFFADCVLSKLLMPAAPGARLRYQIDRESKDFRRISQQRTTVERIFSQAVVLGIERPKLRNQLAIANQNTLIYLLINHRATQRLAHQSA